MTVDLKNKIRFKIKMILGLCLSKARDAILSSKYSRTRQYKHMLGLYFCCLLSACQHTKPSPIHVTDTVRQPAYSSIDLADTKAKKAIQNIPQSSAKDGAPLKPMSISSQNISPIDEPLSHYGNPGSYRVKGEKYDVLTSSEGYKKKGIASWYGTKFHKERTSSGEAYDMYALTAAHKTLPLPTYVRVKNLENGREIIVKVNDRGPFHEDRLIDLSYGAAVKLDLLPKGTASVEIEALSSAPQAHYYLQVGVFQSLEKAIALRDKLTQLSLEPSIQMEKRDTGYVITLGPFLNQKSSENSKKALEQHGILGGFSYLQ